MPERKEKEKTTQAAKQPLASIKEKGATWEEKPLHQKKKREVSEDQEGCEQTSQQTTPD